ncbi:DNA cytosine methyltransferase [Xanthomonas campestris pv. campestris]|nr:DNA cytosine methyltransferase [Xanthomonas campestris pv. campestris]WDL67556.1 DNA cytosine methyltransferase [Xanthomonas campestris pv. campestris]
MKVAELFAGVGGMTLGAARAGLDVRLAVELDQRAMSAHVRNFPSSNHLTADVSTLGASDLLDAAKLKPGQLDGLIGGPPCQGFSAIGKKELGDPRNSLFGHFVRLVLETQPRFFLAENVNGILAPRNQEFLEAAFLPLHGQYDLLSPLVIKASDVGAPTSRTRVFFVGIHRSSGYRSFDVDTLRPQSSIGSNPVGHALKGLPATIDEDWTSNIMGRTRLHKVASSPYHNKIADDRPDGVGESDSLRLLEKGIVLNHQGTIHSPDLQLRYARLGPGEQDYKTKSVRLYAKGFCPTLRAGTGAERGSFQAVRPIHHRMPRVITPREAARLQSFPDWFSFDQTKWQAFRQIGNSVPPILAEAVLRRLLTSI